MRYFNRFKFLRNCVLLNYIFLFLPFACQTKPLKIYSDVLLHTWQYVLHNLAILFPSLLIHWNNSSAGPQHTNTSYSLEKRFADSTERRAAVTHYAFIAHYSFKKANF